MIHEKGVTNEHRINECAWIPFDDLLCRRQSDDAAQFDPLFVVWGRKNDA